MGLIMETVGVFLAALLTLAAPEETAKVGYYQLPVIAGVWQIELENVDKAVCQERYHFGRLGKLSTSSAGEITQGQYHFSYVEDNQVSLPILAMHTLYDNNAPDCRAIKLIKQGSVRHFLLNWIIATILP